MTPERWIRIEELYEAASARPADQRAAYLAVACGDDDGLRQEVASLLQESDSNHGFLAQPAFVRAAPMMPGLDPAAIAGRTIGAYHVQALIGIGGMGEVYRARDSTLGRDVAIKVLPRAFTNDPGRLGRFEREARMLAALNHPNICAIYGTDVADGLRLLVLELVEGTTLADTLADASGPLGRQAGLPLDLVLAIARQIADALEAAHEKGIVHRDLKPANIKITPGGIVKVLDFGLAKAVGGDGASPDLTQSPLVTRDGGRDGALIGTAAYMSPEQARGAAVDKRTDIWAFGCVLYEMLTGRLAFAGETVSDTIARILEREPDWSALPAATPAHLRRLLLRCLAKDPKQRLRDVGDVRIEIDAVDQQPPGTPASRHPRLRRGVAWLSGLTLVAAAAVLVWWGARRPVSTQENPLVDARFSRLTNWEGTEGGAEISPDGQFVTFFADRGGEVGLWLTQVGTGLFSQLTPNQPPKVPLGIPLRTFGFSGDGAQIWFAPVGAATSVVVPLIGGTPHPFLTKDTTSASWSHDGTRIAYATADPGQGDRLFVADRTGGDARQVLPGAGGMHAHNPVWSSDNEWIYFVRGPDPTDAMDVWRIRPSGGSPEQVTTGHPAASIVAPLDSRTLLYVARADDHSGPWLWARDVASGRTTRVGSGLEQYTWVAASRDGRRVVATVANPTTSLWRVPLADGPAVESDVRPYALPVPTGRALAPRFRGASLFYLSARGTSDGLWRARDGKAAEVWRDVEGAFAGPPAISPDGQSLAVIVRRGGKRRVAVLSAEGTNLRTVSASIDVEGAAGQGAADWSPDGRWIVTGGVDSHGPALFKVPAAGGEPVRLANGPAINPVWSPDGALIVYSGPIVAGQADVLGVRPDGASVDMPSIRAGQGRFRFLPDGSGLVYQPREALRDYWLLNLATRRTRRLTQFANRGTVQTFDITPDGKEIVFDRSHENADVVLIELPR
jgi:serine/threonine protein kinase/Tol biopolymer transport system component